MVRKMIKLMTKAFRIASDEGVGTALQRSWKKINGKLGGKTGNSRQGRGYYPWDTSFEERVNSLCRGHMNGKNTAVYLYENPDSSTFRYRAYNMCQALEHSNKWVGAYFFSYELGQLREYVRHISLAVAVRYRWDESLDNFLAECRKNKISTAMDLDDMVFDTGNIKLFMNAIGESMTDENALNYWFSSFSRIDSTAALYGSFSSTNEFLAEKLRKFYNKPSFCVKNFMNREQLDISASLKREKRSGAGFVIGYFSGSPTHRHDLGHISGELADAMEKFPGIKLKITGYMDVPQPLAKFLRSKRVVLEKFRDYRELQRTIAGVDLNIVPLAGNDFTDCKSELKFFEAAVVDTPTCASPAFTYRNAITHGKNGYLCGTGEWHGMIKDLYNNGISDMIVNNAKKYALQNYSPESQVKPLEEALDGMAGEHNEAAGGRADA